MAILKIAKMGHPVLRRRAVKIDDPTAPEIRRLVRDMIETMEDAGGAGLAAPQVHVPLRLVMFFVPEGRDRERPDAIPLTVLANPEIEPLGAAMENDWEACLSVPGLTGRVPRHRRIRYRGTTPEGEVVERVADGFHARVVQHECDHLDGVLYPQRMDDLSLLMFRDQMQYGIPRPGSEAEDEGAPEREPETTE